MTTTATISSTWRNRQLMIAAFLSAFGLWFLWDGAIGYPKQNVQFEKHAEMVNEGRGGEWEAFSKEKGWAAKPPKHLHTESDIRTQYYLGGVSIALGLAALAWLGICARRNLRMDEEAIYGDRGQRLPFDGIVGVDKQKWDSKGIAYALYEENGKRRRLTLDDYKYAGGDEILKEIETRLGIVESPGVDAV